MVRPISTIRQTEPIRLWQAWLIHLVGLGLCVIAAAIGEGLLLVYSFVGFKDMWLTISRMLSREDVVTGIAGMIAFEAAFVLAAWGLMAWSAWPHEKIAASFARALKRVWLLTSLGVILIAAIIFTGLTFEDLLPRHALIPWAFGVLMFVALSAALGAAPIVIGLWAMAADRSQQSCRWPGQCEGCGYPLIGLSMTQACPECGQAVSDSLGPDVRLGCASDRHLRRGWLHTSYQALLQPRRLGQALQVMTLTPRHSRALAINMTLLGLVGPLAVLPFIAMESWDFANDGWAVFGRLLEYVIIGGGVLGFYLLSLGLIGVLASSSLIGSILSHMARRNILPLATQAASYASVWLALWAMVMAIAAIVLILFASFYFRHQSTPSWFMTLSIITSIVLPLVGVAVWLGLVWRITWAGRYANR